MSKNSTGEKMLTAKEAMEKIKEGRVTVDKDILNDMYSTSHHLIKEYQKAGQEQAIKDVFFECDVIEKELKLLKHDINTYVYEEDLLSYVNKVSERTVIIQLLKDYTRLIPERIVKSIADTKEIFDEYIVVFTDYTGKERKKVEKIRREKDPIVFGVFKDTSRDYVCSRYYFIGDWVDEYCDLTLDKMVKEMASKGYGTVAKKVDIQKDIRDLKDVYEKKEAAEKRKREITKMPFLKKAYHNIFFNKGGK